MQYIKVPNYLDYQNKANELFMIGLYQLFDLKFSYNDFNFRYKQKLSMCNSNLQQCCELYLKSLLCKISPYLLIRESMEKTIRKNIETSITSFYKNIEGRHSDVGVLDKFHQLSTVEIEFDSCYTIEAGQLWNEVSRLYGADYFKSKYVFNFNSFYTKNRDVRNTFMHSHDEEEIVYNDLILSYLAIFDIFNKKSLIKLLYKDMLKQVFNKNDNPIRDPFKRVSSNQHLIDNPWNRYNSISLSKKSVTCDIRYALMRYMEIIFNSLKNSNNQSFFNLYDDFRKNDKSYHCPYCENYYRAAAEEKDSILSSKYSITLFNTLPNKDNLFNFDGFFKSFYPITKGSSRCQCVICGISKTIEYSGHCIYCVENELSGQTYFLNNKCITCGCSIKKAL